MDRYAESLWDVQSKGVKNNSPAALGKEIVTLFKNNKSDIDFKEYILFLRGVSPTVRVDEAIDVFDLSNIKTSALSKLKEGLKKEAVKKTYINSSDITDSNIDAFLKKVTFVVDDKSQSEYVKAIIKDHPNIITEEKMLNVIFNKFII